MLMLKPANALLCAAILVLGLCGAIDVAAQNTAPPVAAFFQRPVFSGAALSPDGTLVAMRVGGLDSRDRLAVLDLASMKVLPVASFSDADVDHFRWVNSSRLVFNLADHRGLREEAHAAPGLYAVNADGSGFRQLVARDKAWSRDTSGTSQLMERDRVYKPDNTGTNQPTERERVVGRDGITSNQLPYGSLLFEQTGSQDSNFVFVLLPDGLDTQQGGPYKLARVNTVGGRSEDLDAPANAVQWLLDKQGDVRAVLTQKDRSLATSPRVLRLREPGTGTWRMLGEVAADFTLRALPGDGKLYVTSVNGKERIGNDRNGNERPGRDTLAVFALDTSSGRLADQPLLGTAMYDITPEFISTDKALLGLRFTVDAQTTQWFDASLQALQADVDKLLPTTANMLSPPQRGNSPWLLVRAFADVQAAVHHVYNSQTKKLTRLGAEQPGIQASAMSAMDLHRFKARDGVEIPAYLTLPVGAAQKKNLPLIVWAADNPPARGSAWSWQGGVQFLASRGYAVLQPIARGADGFGQKFAALGFNASDLGDAARWAVAQGLADAKRVCVIGSELGGNAALQALASDAAVFRCGVVWAAGSASTAIALSASARIQSPTLLAHGRLDRVVPLSQAQKVAEAIQLPNASLQWIPYDQEGHGWSSTASTVDWWSQVETFLAKNMGSSKP